MGAGGRGPGAGRGGRPELACARAGDWAAPARPRQFEGLITLRVDHQQVTQPIHSKQQSTTAPSQAMSYAPHDPAYPPQHQHSFQSTSSELGPPAAGYAERSTEQFAPTDYNGIDHNGLRERTTYPPNQGVKPEEDEYNYGQEGAVVNRGSIAAQVSDLPS